ncbi:hypothetical protein [Microbacterium sp. E-13]|uniref:hypothetical protein n=1 Tax=Microbacterium sp. E-13 TaxID=3404048 RepID=UPI003CEFA15A
MIPGAPTLPALLRLTDRRAAPFLWNCSVSRGALVAIPVTASILPIITRVFIPQQDANT